MDDRLRIELLGGLRVVNAGREVLTFRRPKVAALFAYLAFYRDALIRGRS